MGFKDFIIKVKILTYQLHHAGKTAVHETLKSGHTIKAFPVQSPGVKRLSNSQQTTNSLIVRPLSGSPNCAW